MIYGVNTVIQNYNVMSNVSLEDLRIIIEHLLGVQNFSLDMMLSRYGILLPNLILSFGFILSIIIVWLFIPYDSRYDDASNTNFTKMFFF